MHGKWKELSEIWKNCWTELGRTIRKLELKVDMGVIRARRTLF